MSYEVSLVANYHKGEAFPFQLLIFLFTHNYLNTPVMAINTLAKVTPRWNKVAADFNENFKSAAYKLPDSRHVFLGSLIQRFNLMKGKPANPYTDLIEQIKIAICQTLVPDLKENKMLLDDYPEHLVDNLYTLAEIRNFDALMTFSNEYAVPVFDLKDDQIAQSGAALNSMTEKRDKIKSTFDLLSDYLLEELAEL